MVPLSWFIALRRYAEDCAFSLSTQAQDYAWDLAEYKRVEPAHCPTVPNRRDIRRDRLRAKSFVGIPTSLFYYSHAPCLLHDWGVRT